MMSAGLYIAGIWCDHVRTRFAHAVPLMSTGAGSELDLINDAAVSESTWPLFHTSGSNSILRLALRQEAQDLTGAVVQSIGVCTVMVFELTGAPFHTACCQIIDVSVTMRCSVEMENSLCYRRRLACKGSAIVWEADVALGRQVNGTQE